MLMPKCGHGGMSCAKITHVLGACGIAEIQCSKGGGHGGSGIRGTQSFSPHRLYPLLPGFPGIALSSGGWLLLKLYAWPEIASLQLHVWWGLGSGD